MDRWCPLCKKMRWRAIVAVALFIAIALPEGMPHQSLWGFLAGAIAFEFLGKIEVGDLQSGDLKSHARGLRARKSFSASSPLLIDLNLAP